MLCWWRRGSSGWPNRNINNSVCAVIFTKTLMLEHAGKFRKSKASSAWISAVGFSVSQNIISTHVFTKIDCWSSQGLLKSQFIPRHRNSPSGVHQLGHRLPTDHDPLLSIDHNVSIATTSHKPLQSSTAHPMTTDIPTDREPYNDLPRPNNPLPPPHSATFCQEPSHIHHASFRDSDKLLTCSGCRKFTSWRSFGHKGLSFV